MKGLQYGIQEIIGQTCSKRSKKSIYHLLLYKEFDRLLKK